MKETNIHTTYLTFQLKKNHQAFQINSLQEKIKHHKFHPKAPKQAIK